MHGEGLVLSQLHENLLGMRAHPENQVKILRVVHVVPGSQSYFQVGYGQDSVEFDNPLQVGVRRLHNR